MLIPAGAGADPDDDATIATPVKAATCLAHLETCLKPPTLPAGNALNVALSSLLIL